jgi:hypothetical protein
MFLVETEAETDLSRANLRGAGAAAPSSEDWVALKAEIERTIADPERRARVLARFELVLREPSPAWEPDALPAKRRRDVLVSENMPEPIRALMGGAALLSPGDDRRYGQALVEELAPLACDLNDGRVASRFVERIRVLDEDVPLRDLHQRFKNNCPGLIAKLDPDAQKVLTGATAKAANAAAAGSTSQASAPAAR